MVSVANMGTWPDPERLRDVHGNGQVTLPLDWAPRQLFTNARTETHL